MRKGLFLLIPALTLLPGSVKCQVIPDTLRLPPDSLEAEALPRDSLLGQEAQQDSIQPADTLPAVELPSLARPVPAGWATGIWEWDREEILGSKAITLAELVAEVPGTVYLRGGDYGAPVAVSAFGAGGGRLKVFRDEVEIVPLEGSVPDLARIGLGGVRSVRVVRFPGEIRVEIETLLTEGGRPYSLVQAGTGDLNTNLFRGTFSHPRALGGAVALAMDRVDTQGPGGSEPGSATGVWVRYARPLFAGGVAAVDLSRAGSDRGELYSPEKATRTDWTLRTRWTLLPGLVGDLFYASSSLKTEEADTFDFGLESRTRLGGVLSWESPRVSAKGNVQKVSGEGLPQTEARVEMEGKLFPFGGLGAELSWESWETRSVTRTRYRAWSSPYWGLSLFAEHGSGEWGLPFLPAAPLAEPDSAAQGEEDPTPPDTVPPVLPGPRFSSSSSTRMGAQFQWRGLSLSGARLSVETDSLFPLGLPSDRSGETFPGGSRKGYEVAGRIPLYPQGMALEGWYQWWDQPKGVWAVPEDSLAASEPLPDQEMPWRYLPRMSYQGSLSFHNSYLPTQNLELWFDLGVRGRDPMVVPFREEVDGFVVPSHVPFYQSWYVRLQIRVVTVRLFIAWDNFTLRQRNQDFPGRILPISRSLYGVRWTMRN